MLRIALLVAAAQAVVADDAAWGQASSVISWSGMEGMYANTNGLVTDDVAVADLASYFKLEQAPKVAVVFSLKSTATRAFPHLIKDGKLDGVVDAVHNAESGLVVANTFGAGGSIADFVKAVPSEVCGVDAKPTLYALRTDAVTSDVQDAFDVQVLSDLSSVEKAVASVDGTVFLYAPLMTGNDEHLGLVMDAVEEATDGQFVAFAVPSAYDDVMPAARAAAPRKLAAAAAPARKLATAATGSAVRMTPNIMLGLLVSVFFIFILVVFFGKMMDIRPNDKHWLSETVPLGSKVEM